LGECHKARTFYAVLYEVRCPNLYCSI